MSKKSEKERPYPGTRVNQLEKPEVYLPRLERAINEQGKKTTPRRTNQCVRRNGTPSLKRRAIYRDSLCLCAKQTARFHGNCSITYYREHAVTRTQHLVLREFLKPGLLARASEFDIYLFLYGPHGCQ